MYQGGPEYMCLRYPTTGLKKDHFVQRCELNCIREFHKCLQLKCVSPTMGQKEDHFVQRCELNCIREFHKCLQLKCVSPTMGQKEDHFVQRCELNCIREFHKFLPMTALLIFFSPGKCSRAEIWLDA